MMLQHLLSKHIDQQVTKSNLQLGRRIFSVKEITVNEGTLRGLDFNRVTVHLLASI